MENELTRLVDALPGLVWAALLTGTSTSSIGAGANTRALALTNPMAGGGQTAIHPKTCLGCSNAGDRFWFLASQVKWKHACGS